MIVSSEIVPFATIRIVVMALHRFERIDWMPSPPLVPDDGPIDLVHLQRMTLGDSALEREVLAMFAAQAARLMGALAELPPDSGAMVHTLKGAARAVGACEVGSAAERLEAALKSEGGVAHQLADLQEAVARASGAIEAILRRA